MPLSVANAGSRFALSTKASAQSLASKEGKGQSGLSLRGVFSCSISNSSRSPFIGPGYGISSLLPWLLAGCLSRLRLIPGDKRLLRQSQLGPHGRQGPTFTILHSEEKIIIRRTEC